MTMQLFYGDVCNVSYKECMIIYLVIVCVVQRDSSVDKMMMISHLKPDERSYICLPHM
jgi:hypothetical protein